MGRTLDVAVLVGSLRKDSINRKMANALAELAHEGLKLSIVEIGQLPIYNQDADENPPTEWKAFRERIRAADAVLFVTPEHNRSVGANHHLRQSLVFLNVPAMAQPEAYCGGADKFFDANGKIINDGTRQFLKDFMQAYNTWVIANIKS
jgi:chromate reductase